VLVIFGVAAFLIRLGRYCGLLGIVGKMLQPTFQTPKLNMNLFERKIPRRSPASSKHPKPKSRRRGAMEDYYESGW
jgi:hypothetical protein